MKLFIREHRAFIVLQCLQVIFMIGLLWLSSFREIEVLLYIAVIHFFLASLYLFYYFITRRSIYRKKQDEFVGLSDGLTFLGYYPLPEHLQQILRDQYKAFESEIISLESDQKEYLTYIDLWAHQMKTPLSVIELMAQDADEPLSSDLREEVERMKNGLHMMLSMARLRTIERDFRVKGIRIQQLFASIMKDNRRLFIRNDLFPNVRIENEEMLVYSDEKWLYFIIEQLIHNAVKYSSGKGKYIYLTAYKQENEKIIEIADEGVGIPLADQKRIFEPFFTGENGRSFRQESTGIGLYIVKEICQYLDHQIIIESSLDQGTSVKLILK